MSSQRPTATAEQTFWERLAARTRLAGAAATIESPRTVMRIATGAAWAAAANAVFTAFAFFWFDEPAAGIMTVAVTVSYLGAWVWYAKTGSVLDLAVITVVASTIDILAVHMLLGGYANSGSYMVWGITQVLIAAIVFPRRVTLGVVALFAASGIAFGVLEPWLAGGRPPPDPTLRALLFVIVLLGNLGLLALILTSILNRLSAERRRAESLLLNVLPAVIAAELKEHGEIKARRFDSVSVLFADVVGFTPMTASIEPEVMVDRLNVIFTHFDTLADRYGCEKIRTIGDGYMVAAGVPVPKDDHAHALAAMALDMLDYIEDGPFRLRIGIDTGPVVAGVIGTRKFQYDVWGDTVNTASRMESHGEPNRIHVTESVRAVLADRYQFQPRGTISVKGKGKMETFFLLG
ncbi:MAG TPA: adenylate/guanylate cyclase domain-containing protein [Acidimicrobiia bacterium]|nr:adenylate/guanylate cyclase domain-containing protein [Acidimicrobiia bacterium]